MELISYTDKFDDPRLPGVMHVTIKLRPVSSGTEIEQFGIPEKCYLGWQQSLAQLAQLVELEIPGSDGGQMSAVGQQHDWCPWLSRTVHPTSCRSEERTGNRPQLP